MSNSDLADKCNRAFGTINEEEYGPINTNSVIDSEDVCIQSQQNEGHNNFNASSQLQPQNHRELRRHQRVRGLRFDVVGSYQRFEGPYGPKPLVYADWTASGRAIHGVERYMLQTALPFFANTHTTTSTSGHQSTCFRHEARQIVAEACNAKITGKAAIDVVLFTGNGTTAAIGKLIDVLDLKIPLPSMLNSPRGHIKFGGDQSNEKGISGSDIDHHNANNSSNCESCVDINMSDNRTETIGSMNERPIVFTSSYEHHSNLLPWRESVADVVTIKYHPVTGVCLVDLELQLRKYATSHVKIGAFSAASNVTGLLTAVEAVSVLLHLHGALAVFDYATAAPYIHMDMNPAPAHTAELLQTLEAMTLHGGRLQGGLLLSNHAHLAYKDAIVFSGHKFVGGPGCPGVLVAKRRLLPQSYDCPSAPAGGTVFYVTNDHQRYLSNREEREEGGTPNVLGDVKLGLVLRLKQSIGAPWVHKEEMRIARYVRDRLSAMSPRIVLLGHDMRALEHGVGIENSAGIAEGRHLPVFSFLIRCQQRFLHYSFVCALLNDLFGVQARGGCMCAGPYSQRLLGITSNANLIVEQALLDKHEVLRPGFARLTIPYWVGQTEIDYVVDAIGFVAEHGWKFLSAYRCNHKTGEWAHASRLTKFPERLWLSHFDIADVLPSTNPENEAANANNSHMLGDGSGKSMLAQTLSQQWKDVLNPMTEKVRKSKNKNAASATAQENNQEEPIEEEIMTANLLQAMAAAAQTELAKVEKILEKANKKRATASSTDSASQNPHTSTSVVETLRWYILSEETMHPSFQPEPTTAILGPIQPHRWIHDSSMTERESQEEAHESNALLPATSAYAAIRSVKLTARSASSSSSGTANTNVVNGTINDSSTSGSDEHKFLPRYARLQSYGNDIVEMLQNTEYQLPTAPIVSLGHATGTLTTTTLNAVKIRETLLIPKEVKQNNTKTASNKKSSQAAADFEMTSDPPLHSVSDSEKLDKSISTEEVPLCLRPRQTTRTNLTSTSSSSTAMVSDPPIGTQSGNGMILNGPGVTYSAPAPGVPLTGKHVVPPKKLMKSVGQAISEWAMIEDGDRLLLGLSGGKDSMALLHILLALQKRAPVRFEISCATVDPQTESFDPSPLIPYVQSLGVTYHYLSEPIVELAKTKLQGDSLCAFCSRFKRGLLYSCCRANGYNKLVLAQHLDDLGESFLMSVLHNGQMRTMKANYCIEAGDVRVIRPLIYARERATRDFSQSTGLPIINENCPACFEQPKERDRVKKLLAQEEAMIPGLYFNLRRALTPLMHDDTYAAMAQVTKEIESRAFDSSNPKRDRGANKKRSNTQGASAQSMEAIDEEGEDNNEDFSVKKLRANVSGSNDITNTASNVIDSGKANSNGYETSDQILAGILDARSSSTAACDPDSGYCATCYELA